MPAIVKELPAIPAERALKVLSGRWKIILLYYLFEGPKRLSEFKRLMPFASQKVLVQQLREMEEHGLLRRKVFAQVPPRVEYSATKLGMSLEPITATLCEWGKKHANALREIEDVGGLEKPASVRRPKASERGRTPKAAGTI